MVNWAAQLPWTKVKALADSGAWALLPVGSTEAHGPHLPLNVDVVIAEGVCEKISEALSKEGHASIIFPAMAYGVTDFAASFSGTVSLSADTTKAFLKEVLCGIAGHGFRHIAVFNHHLEPAHFKVVHQASVEAQSVSGARVEVVDHRRKPTGPLLGEEFMHGGSHAGNYETSLMLALAPHAVDEGIRKSLPELAVDLPAKIKSGAKTFNECGGLDAYMGNPQMASAEEGQRLLQVLCDAALAQLKLY